MIRFYGDVHRSFFELESMIADSGPEIQAHIQVGDLGIWPLGGMPPGTRDLNPVHPLYFVEGNWDYMPWFRDHTEPVELMPNVIYVPRGTILELDGRRVAFLGGARSISTYGRTKGVNWWPLEEEIRSDQILSFRGKQADVLVTHTPPQFAIDRLFSGHRPMPRFSGHTMSLMDAILDAEFEDPKKRDRSAELVERAWEILGRPVLVSGHMHRSAHYEDVRVHVLKELETLDL